MIPQQPITAEEMHLLLKQSIWGARLKKGDTFIVPKMAYDLIVSLGVPTVIEGVKVAYPDWDEWLKPLDK